MQAREQLLRAFLNRYYPIPELPDLKPSPGFEERAKRFTGSYGITRAASTTYEKVASLLMVASICTTDEGTLLLKLSAVLTIGVLIFAFLAWKNKYWSICGRVHYSLIGLASRVFIWFLNYWNLLGFRF